MKHISPQHWSQPDDRPGAGSSEMAAAPMDEPIAESVKRRRRLRYLLIGAGPALLVALLIAAVMFQRSSDMTVTRADLQLATATTAVITESARFVGRVTPRGLIQLASPENGRVAAIMARSGDRVVKGQPIVRLTNPERELAISDRMARIRSEMTNIIGRRVALIDSQTADRRAVLQAEFDRIDAAEKLNRQEILLKAGVVSEAHLEPLRARLAFTETIVAEAKATIGLHTPMIAEQRAAIDAQLAALRGDYAATARQREAFTVTAPATGVVLGFEVELGQAIDGGSRLAQIDPLEGGMIVAQLDEYYIARVRPGQVAETLVEGRSYRLRVAHVSPDVRDGSFRIELEFADGAPPRLRPGETIQGTIDFPGGGRQVAIANGPYLEQTAGNYLFVLDDAGTTAVRRAVKTGVRAPDRVAITQGLADGERVIVSSYRQFGDAQTLRITAR